MSTKLKISEVPSLLQIAHAADVPVLLEGSHGIGKSEILEHAASQMGVGFRALDLSLLEPVDLVGIPMIEDKRTQYAPPAILPREGRGLLLLEELNRASPQTRTPALELLTRRQLHEYHLPVGWLPCASINPQNEGYTVDALDPALLSRFLVVRVEADHGGWVQWAREKGLHTGVVDYVEASPDIFTSTDVNPRALEYASKILSAFEASGHVPRGDNLLIAALAGLVGESMAVSLLRFLKGARKPLAPEEVLSAYAAHRPALKEIVRQGRLDLAQKTLQKLKHHLQRQKTWDEVEASTETMDNLHAFLGDLPPDLKNQFEEWTVERGYQFTMQP